MKIGILLCILAAIVFPQSVTNDKCDDDNENLACCFINAPGQLTQSISIADRNEPGERLHIKGEIRKADGKTPAQGVVLYAYHTNKMGVYPKKGNEAGIHKWHGYLHSWGITNNRGEFEINSIRPAQYPTRTTPAHIHIVVKEPGGAIYYINDIMFDDDPLVSNKKEEGVIALKKSSTNIWQGSVVLRLRK